MIKITFMLLVSFVFSTVSSNAYAGEKVDKSLQVEASGYVEIHNVRGEVDIVGWPNDEVKVIGNLDDMTEKFIFTTNNGHTIIKVILPTHSTHRSRNGSQLKVMVPQDSKLSFSSVATDIKLNNVSGGVEVNSESGELIISKVKGRVIINSVSGKIELDSIEGSLEVSTVSGNLKAILDCDNVIVSAVSADIDLRLKQIKSAKLSNVSGNIKLAGLLLDNGELKLTSVSGDAFYHFATLLNAQVIMETAPGGEIINQYSEHKPKSSFISSHDLRFSSGDGSGIIRMSTVSGKIGLIKG